MKFLLVVSLLCVSFAFRNQVLGLGRSCQTKTPFVVTNFDVQPYPPTSGQRMLATMSGTFSQTEFISDVAIRQNYNGGKYTTSYVDISQNCIYGQVNTFYVNVTAGTQSGIYDVQIQLETKQGSAISCWDFTYHI